MIEKQMNNLPSFDANKSVEDVCVALGCHLHHDEIKDDKGILAYNSVQNFVSPSLSFSSTPSTPLFTHCAMAMNIKFYAMIVDFLDVRSLLPIFQRHWVGSRAIENLVHYCVYRKNFELLKDVLNSTTLVLSSFYRIDWLKISKQIEIPLDILVYENEFGFARGQLEHLLKNRKGTLKREMVHGIISRDNLEVFKKYQRFMKTISLRTLLSIAHWKGSKKILEYLYRMTEPLKNYLPMKFIRQHKLDPFSRDFLETMCEDENMLLKVYEAALDVEKLNRRLMIICSVVNYRTFEIFLHHGLKIDIYTPIAAVKAENLKLLKMIYRKCGSLPEYLMNFNSSFAILAFFMEIGFEITTDDVKIYSPREYRLAKILGFDADIGNIRFKTLQDVFDAGLGSKEDFEKIVNDSLFGHWASDNSDDLNKIIEHALSLGIKLKHNMYLKSLITNPQKFIKAVCKGIPVDQHVTGEIAHYGEMETLKALFEVNVPILSITGFMNGNIVTKFLDMDKEVVDTKTLEQGLKNNDFEVLDTCVIFKKTDELFKYEQIGDKDSKMLTPVNECVLGNKLVCTVLRQKPPIDEGCIQVAARHGHFEMVKYLIERGVPIDGDCLYEIIERGYDEIFPSVYEHLKTKSKELEFSNVIDKCFDLSKSWCRSGIRDFLISKGEQRTQNMSNIKWVESGDPGDLVAVRARNNWRRLLKITKPYKNLGTSFVTNNYLECLRESLDFLDKKDTVLVDTAARLGRFEILRFLVSEGFLMSPSAIRGAVKRKRFEIAEFLLKIRCPIPSYNRQNVGIVVFSGINLGSECTLEELLKFAEKVGCSEYVKTNMHRNHMLEDLKDVV